MSITTGKTRYAEEPHLTFAVSKTADRPLFSLISGIPKDVTEKATEGQLQTLADLIASLVSQKKRNPSQSEVVRKAKEQKLGSRNTILRALVRGVGTHWESKLDQGSRVYWVLGPCPPVHPPSVSGGQDNPVKRRVVQSSSHPKRVGQLDRVSPVRRVRTVVRRPVEDEEVVDLVD